MISVGTAPPTATPRLDFSLQLAISVFLIVGVYQFYFFCQRHPLRAAREFAPTFLDRWVPYRPGWVWIYSGLYYPIILYTVWVVRDPRQFVHTVASYFVLLFAQMACFLAFPVVTPPGWRVAGGAGSGWNQRFVDLVQSLDSPANCFPSMHCSVAMLTALHLLPHSGAGIFLFPVLIAVSCLYTKQHYAIDLLPGALLGWGIHALSVNWFPALRA